MQRIIFVTIAGLLLLIMPEAVREGFCGVPHTFTAGTTAMASEVNANFSDLDTRLGSLEGGQQGSTSSDGCLDKSPGVPDCAACSIGSCTIGTGAAYPAANWVYLAKYTLPADGELVVSVGHSVVCQDIASAGSVLGVSLAVAEDAPGFPPADPGDGVIAYTELTLAAGRDTYELIPWKTTLLTGEIMTQGVLTSGTTYKIFLNAVTVSGNVFNACSFTEAPVHLQFTPLPAATVTITPN